MAISSKSRVFLECNIPSFDSSAELRGEIHFTWCSLMYLWKNWMNSISFLDMFWLEMDDGAQNGREFNGEAR